MVAETKFLHVAEIIIILFTTASAQQGSTRLRESCTKRTTYDLSGNFLILKFRGEMKFDIRKILLCHAQDPG